MRVAVTGGTGYVGTALRRGLEARGHEAMAVRRGRAGEPDVMFDPGAEWVRPGALEAFDAVVHLSGVSIAGRRWTAARRRLLRSSRIDSAHVLVEHLRTLQRPPRVLVSASAIGYYGDGGERELTEEAGKGTGFLADLVADWEREVARASEFGVRTVSTRFAPIIGPNSELLRRLLPPFRFGVGGRLGSGRQWFSWVAIEDVIRAVEFALEHDEFSGPVNVVAPGLVRNNEFTRALGAALQRPTVCPVPAFALRALFGRDLADEVLLVSQRVVPARLLAVGFDFDHPTLASALRAYVRGQ